MKVFCQRKCDDREELRLLLYEFCEEVSYDLRHRGLRGKTVTLKARYWNFKTVTRSKTVDVPINSGKGIYAVARGLLERIPEGPLRLLGVQISNLEDVRAPVQTNLFGIEEVGPTVGEGERERRASSALDDLRRRYGRGTVVPASLLGRVRERKTPRISEGEE